MKTDSVRAMQHIYRRLVDAISHPGEAWQIIPHPHLALEEDQRAVWIASVMLTLVDHEVSVHIAPSPDASSLDEVVNRRARAANVSVHQADFVAAHIDHMSPELVLSMKRGSLDYPDDGATLVLQVESLTSNGSPSMTLSGPGILDQRVRPLGDLSTGFVAARNEVTSDYPLGIDVIVVDRSGHVMAIPRTTSVSVRDGEL